MLEKNQNLILNISEVMIKSLANDLSVLSDYYSIYHSFSKSDLNIKSIKNNSGVYYENRLRIFYPGLDKHNFQLFNKMLNYRFVLIFKTCNGDRYQLGDFNIPLSLSIDFKEGTTLSFRNKSIYPLKELSSVNYSSNSSGFPFKIIKQF